MINQLIRIVVLGLLAIAGLYLTYVAFFDSAIYDFREDFGSASEQGSIKETLDKYKEFQRELER